MNSTVEFVKTEIYPQVVITPDKTKSRINIMLFWFLMWTICGVMMIFGFIDEQNGNNKVFLFVCIMFWAYFEFKVWNTYKWRKGGKEIIVLGREELQVKEIVNSSEKQKSFKYGEIKSIGVPLRSETNFFQFLDNSFWDKGSYNVHFMTDSGKQGFGRQLSIDDQKRMMTYLRQSGKFKPAQFA